MEHPASMIDVVLAYGGTAAWAAFGGLAAYAQKIKKGMCKPSLSEFFGEITISSFVGLLTSFFCERANLDYATSGILVGVAGHMGSRAILLMETLILKKGEAILGKEVIDQVIEGERDGSDTKN